MILKLIAGVVIGGALGYASYRWIGCASGTCPLTSNPWISTIYGMVLGALATGGVFR